METVGSASLRLSTGLRLPISWQGMPDAVPDSDPVPGASFSYNVTVKGLLPGPGTVTTSVVTPAVPGTTVVNTGVIVNGRFNRIGT